MLLAAKNQDKVKPSSDEQLRGASALIEVWRKTDRQTKMKIEKEQVWIPNYMMRLLGTARLKLRISLINEKA